MFLFPRKKVDAVFFAKGTAFFARPSQKGGFPGFVRFCFWGFAPENGRFSAFWAREPQKSVPFCEAAKHGKNPEKEIKFRPKRPNMLSERAGKPAKSRTPERKKAPAKRYTFLRGIFLPKFNHFGLYFLYLEHFLRGSFSQKKSCRTGKNLLCGSLNDVWLDKM